MLNMSKLIIYNIKSTQIMNVTLHQRDKIRTKDTFFPSKEIKELTSNINILI